MKFAAAGLHETCCGASVLSTRRARTPSSKPSSDRCAAVNSFANRIADWQKDKGGSLSSVKVQAREYRFSILVVRSGKSVVRLRSVAARVRGSRDFLVPKSDRLFDVE